MPTVWLFTHDDVFTEKMLPVLITPEMQEVPHPERGRNNINPAHRSANGKSRVRKTRSA